MTSLKPPAGPSEALLLVVSVVVVGLVVMPALCGLLLLVIRLRWAGLFGM